MKTAVLKIAKVSSIQLIILLFAMAYSMDSHAGNVNGSSKAVFSGKAPQVRTILLARGQAYVPPPKLCHKCRC
jgi:hypothetical protein